MNKTNLLWVTATLVFLLSGHAKAENSILSICNHTDRAVYTTHMRQAGGGAGWQSSGWYKVEANTCFDLDFGTYVGNLYVQAEDEYGAGSWGDGPVAYCVHKTNAFSINNADVTDCTDSQYKKVTADVIAMAPGKNVWDLNANYSTLNLCNRNTVNDIYAAFNRRSGGQSESQGWYFLPAGECKMVDLGKYSGKVSYYAELNGGQLTWGGSAPAFCVNRTSAFKIANSEDAMRCTDPTLKMVAAREIDVHLGNNTVEFEQAVLKTTLKLCNNTSDKLLRSAYAVPSTGTQWQSTGWSSLPSKGCGTIDLGSFTGKVQVYAEWNNGAMYWGSGPFNFCVNRNSDFNMSNATDELTCNSNLNQKMVPAFEFNVVSGTNTFTFN